MKKRFINLSKRIIKHNNPNIDKDNMDIILYGLESIYLTISKLIIIVILSCILGILKEVIILTICYNLLRTTAFGLHATKSIYCLISSLTFFIGGVYLCKFVSLPFYMQVILCFICIICVYKYAPADTYKRPLINSKKRKKYKIISLITSTFISILVVIFNESIISNYLLLGMILSVLMIHPLVYKIFNLPYNNYKNYIMAN